MPNRQHDDEYQEQLQTILDIHDRIEEAEPKQRWYLAAAVHEAKQAKGITYKRLAADLEWSEKYVRDLVKVWTKYGGEGCLRVDTFTFRDHVTLVNLKATEAERIIEAARSEGLKFREALTRVRSEGRKPKPTKARGRKAHVKPVADDAAAAVEPEERHEVWLTEGVYDLCAGCQKANADVIDAEEAAA